MSGHYTKILAAATIASLAGLAQAQLVFVQPVVNNVETVGQRTTIFLDIPAGEDGANNRLLDTEDVVIEVRIVDSNMNVVSGPFNTNIVNGPLSYDNAAGVVGVEANLAAINFAGNLVPGNRILVTARTAGSTGTQNPIGGVGTDIVGLSGVFDADEAIDTVAAIDNAGPVLQNVFVSGGFIYFVFNESLFGSNDSNHTVIGSIDGTDFEVSGTNNFVGNTTATGLAAATIVGANNSVIRYTRDANATNTTLGSFIRPAYEDDNVTPSGALSIFDIVNNFATPQSSQIATPAALAVTSIDWVSTVDPFTNNQVDRLRVVFNNPLQTTGDATFYNRLRVDLNTAITGLENSLITVDLVTADPTNPNAVLLRVDSPNNEAVSADGLRADSDGNVSTGQYTLALDATVGTPPQDLFSQNFTGTADVTVGDDILPTHSLIAIGDTNPRDGHADTVYIVFNEPIANITSNTGFKVVRQGVAVNPIQLINQETGELGMATTVVNGTPANNELPGLVVTRSSIDVDLNGVIETRETNNAVCIAYNALTFDWDDDTLVGLANDPNEAIPGTGNLGAVQVQYLIATGTIVDANGNVYTNGGVDLAAATSADRAAPFLAFARFFTGDNQNETTGVNALDQLFVENDGQLGDSLFNNRFTFVFGENLAAVANGDNESQFRFGVGGINGFDDDGFVGDTSGSFVAQAPTSNIITLRNSNGNPNVVAGTPVSILPGSGYTDGPGNEVSASDTATTNRVAAYVALQAPVDGGTNIPGAFLFDDDNDGFADSIRITMTQAIDPATVQATDFILSLGTITSAAVQGTDIVLTITDNVVPMTSVITGTYRGASDATRIASLVSAGGTGVPVVAADSSFSIRKIPGPDQASQEIAFMDVVGQITLDGTNPCPPGTKIYAMVAAPFVYKATATHNNVAFSVDAEYDLDDLNAFNLWLYGMREFVYLGRDEDNYQYYDNDKDLGDDNSAISTYKDVIALNINASNLTNITFTGNGETSNDRVTNGRLFLAWDVLRSDNGTVTDFYSRYGGPYPFNYGRPILSKAVVTGTDGRFKLHVSAPVSAFNGISRLSSIGRPIILVVEKPDGNRFAVSSVLTSINGGPLLFQHQSRSQTGTNANNATVFNINLTNVGTQSIYGGWNLVPFPRAGGFATSANARPALVDGVTQSNVVIPGTANPALPFTGVLEQFVWWGEGTVDGKWTRDEDSNFIDIIIDPDFITNFGFTMTSFGVQMGSGMNNLVGGYALAYFNDQDWYNHYGVFQFGAPLSGNTLFAGTSGNAFPNSAATQGWGLFSAKNAYDPIAGARTNNGNRLDYVFLFRNNGPNAASLGRPTIEVSSFDLVAETPENDPQDSMRIDAGQAFFGHFTP